MTHRNNFSRISVKTLHEKYAFQDLSNNFFEEINILLNIRSNFRNPDRNLMLKPDILSVPNMYVLHPRL